MMQLTLKFGLTPQSPYVFSSFGFCLTVTQDFREAFRFGTLALQLMERFGEDARTLVVVFGFIHHTQRHFVDAFEPTLRAYYVSFVQGDLAFSGQAIGMHLSARMISGSSLENIIMDAFSFSEQMKAYNQSLIWNVLIIIQRTNLELADRAEEIVKLLGENPNDDAFLEFLCRGGHQEFHVFTFLSFTLRCRYILNDKQSVLILAKKCWRCKGLQAPLIGYAICFYFSALAALDCWKEATLTKRFYFWRIFRKYQRILISWTEKGNPNTLHMVSLLKAEVLASKESEKFETVVEAYYQSINQARRSGFLQDAALSNELLGKYCLKRCDYDLAKDFLTTSKELYFDWGAMKKVRAMESQYQNLISGRVMMDQLSTAIKGRARQGIVSQIDNLRSQTKFY
jgi:histidine kinase